MPYGRLMYDGDNNYTKKEKRMILLTQEAIDKINGLTPGGGAGATFVTQEEYDALPDSKLTDGIEYIIVDSHCELKSYQELSQMTLVALATELNSCSEGYAYKLFNEGIVFKFNIEGTMLPTGKYMYLYSGLMSGYYLNMRITNVTIQEMIDMGATQEQAEQALALNGVRSVRQESPIE